MAETEIKSINGRKLSDDNVRQQLNDYKGEVVAQFNTVVKKTSVEDGKLYLLDKDNNKIDIGTTLPTGSSGVSNISIRKVSTDEIFTLDAELLKTFTVTNNLTNATNSNTSVNVTEGNSYTATISPNTNYAISSITVTIGGIDVTSTVISGNVITIGSVTGNLVITVITTSTLIPCTGITLNNSNLSFTTTDTQTLIATVEPLDTDDTVIWQSSDTSIATVVGGVVTPIRSGNCTITSNCGSQSATCNVTISLPLQTFTITNNLTNCTSNNSNTSIQEGNSYIATITANSNYTISSTSITMGGTDITSSAYNNGVINISNVTSNIVITCNATSTGSAIVTDGLIKSLPDLTTGVTVVNDGTYFNVNSNFTVFAKCKYTGGSNPATVLGGATNPLICQISWEGKIVLTLSDGITYPSKTIDTSSIYTSGATIYIAIVFKDKTATFYVNNVNKGTQAYNIESSAIKDLTVNSSTKEVSWYYYNRALTVAELTQNYTALGGVV